MLKWHSTTSLHAIISPKFNPHHFDFKLSNNLGVYIESYTSFAWLNFL